MRACAPGRAGGRERAHHCATSFMLTLISFITFATQWALPSRPSAAWGARSGERASRLRSRREIPNPSSSDSPSFLLPPDVLLRCSCHSFYKRSCGERKKEPARFLPFKLVRTHADSSCKGAPNLREGGIDCLNRVREHGGSIIIMQDEQRFPAGQLPRRHL